MTESPATRTLLQTIEDMAATADENGYTLREIMDQLDEGAFGAMLFILSLPCMIPFLYLVPQIVAFPMLALAAQMAGGRTQPWLPEKLAARAINKEGLTKTAKGGRKWLGWVETFARPRLKFLTGRSAQILAGLFLCAFCVSIMLPFPGTNSVPAVGVGLVAFGLVQRDGLLVIIGLIIGIAWIGLLLIGGISLIKYLLGLIGIGSGGAEDAESAALILQSLAA